MRIESIRHKALRRFVETGSRRGLDANLVDRLGKMIFFLRAVATTDDFVAPPNYGAHALSGDRTGYWALTVSRNWRMTFRIDESTRIIDLDLEDYH